MSLKKTVKKDSALARVLAQRTGSWLVSHVNMYLERPRKSRHDPGWFHPSALGNPCDALLAFAYIGVEGEAKNNARSSRIMGGGTSRHEDWGRDLHESGASIYKHWGGSDEERKLAEQERYIEIPHIKMRGACDDVVRNPLTKEVSIFEFKTMNSDLWQDLTEPKSDHVLQVHCYMFGKAIFQSTLVYENSNTKELKQYVVKFDRNTWRSIELRLENIIKMVEDKKLPWRTPMANDSKCQFFGICSGFEFK